MSRVHTLRILAALVLLAVSFTATAAKTKFGFVTEATISGFLSPELKRLKIKTVEPGSPAAIAGLLPGDFIIEADGKKIDGAPAREMAGRLKDIKPGQSLRLKVKRGESDVKDIEIVARQ